VSDHKRIALIMADRVAIGADLRMGRMRNIQINAAETSGPPSLISTTSLGP